MTQEKSSAFEKGWDKGYERGLMMAEHMWRRDAELAVELREKVERLEMEVAQLMEGPLP